MQDVTVYIEDVPGGKKITVCRAKGRTLSEDEVVQLVADIKEYLAKQKAPAG